MNELLLNIVEFLSNKNVQTVLSLLTVLFAFLSCLYAYKAVKPKIKVRNIKNTDTSTYNAFIESPTKPCAVARFLIENNSPNKTQIREVVVYHKRKFYKTMNVYNEYFEKETPPLSLLHKHIPDLVICKVPLTLDSFEVKEVQFTFPTFPNISKKKQKLGIAIYVVGKKHPILKAIDFVNVTQYEVPEKITMNGKTMYVVTKNTYKVVPRKNKKS